MLDYGALHLKFWCPTNCYHYVLNISLLSDAMQLYIRLHDLLVEHQTPSQKVVGSSTAWAT